MLVRFYQGQLEGMKTYIVAAYDKELAAFHLPFADAVRDGRVAFEAIGVGPVHAAFGAARLRARLDAAQGNGARVLLVGTAGSYDLTRVPIGSIVVPTSVQLAAAGGEIPALAGLPLAPTWPSPETAHAVKHARVLNTMGITLGDQPTLHSQGDVEHMEAYAALAAFVGSKHSVGVLLGVANEVGPNGRMQWRANEAAAMTAVLEVARAWLAASTPAVQTHH
jgi:nucleoside phosphorylase